MPPQPVGPTLRQNIFAAAKYKILIVELPDEEAVSKEVFMKAAALQKGDLVGVVAPAGPLLDPAVLERGIEVLREMGFRTTLGKNLHRRYRYLAGTDAERLADLMTMFASPEVRGIICLRGGYGSTRLLPYLDYRLIRDNPKVFIGYSDITALHLALHKKTGLVTFLGPMLAPDLGANPSAYTRESFLAAITSRKPPGRLPHPPGAPPPVTICPGRASGKIIGGNLSLLAAVLGTPFAPDTTGSILLLEEIGEDPYRIDRMLTQLKQSGALAPVRGIIIGECVACEPQDRPQPDDSFTLADVFREHLGSLGIPCLYGLPLGHGRHKATIPLGLTAVLDASRGSLTFNEAGVV